MSPKISIQTDTDRMACYAALAAAFSYPGPSLFQSWPQWAGDEQGMVAEYDRLFRAQSLWLYGAEHLAENEFQRARLLSDIMGFYRAFGIEPDKDRPDALACELEFMHCLILKHHRIAGGAVSDPTGDKAEVCRQAQRTFFEEHLAPAVVRIASEVQLRTTHPFYRQAADDLLRLLEAECDNLSVSPPQPREKRQGDAPCDPQDSCGGACI
jgi:TorA maturation chaperone TorD